MAVMKLTLGIIGILAIGMIVFLFLIGFFQKIVIEEKKIGPFVLIYEEHKGDYKGTGKIQDDIYYSLLNEHKIETYKGFGIYYDNPKDVAVDDLRSIAGCILEINNHDKIEYLRERGFKIKEIPAQNSIVSEFPYKNSFSIMIGIIKVYPKIEKYLKENNIENNEMMEIYNIPDNKIIYVMPK